jgi:asparagine synthase (glutamine-hydrolysing)
MCGIAGIVRFDNAPVESTDIRRMCSAIAHRGPDDAGFALFDRVGLGHVRLSIVDVGAGHQPLHNEDHSIAVICNGEIYDYADHQRELTRRGHRLRTSSDSELLVHLYEEYGADLLHHLNGEFAFILWDDRRKRLLAGRDPCGIKPLYYHASANELLLCSETKGIYALDRVERKLSTRYLVGPALGIYLNDASAFENVCSLRPGHYLIVEQGKTPSECEYFRPHFDADDSMSFADATAAIRERLTAAVRRRLAADVPVHAYLSGGLDSTIICGLMAECGANFTCYNVGFPDSPYDESKKARRIAEHFGQRFETVPCNQEKIAENLARAVYCAEMPLNNYNSVAKTILSGYVRSRGQKVCLTGEGSDELFAGYPYFKLELLWRMQAAGGSLARESRALQKRFRAAEYRSEGLLWDRSERWKRSSKLFGYPSYFNLRARDANQCVRRFFDIERLGLTAADMPSEILRRSVDAKQLEGLDPFNKSRLLTFNQLYNIVIPALGDRVEMANSLECRPPFLDRELIELAGAIPPRYLIDLERLREKNLLRIAFADLLPPVLQKEHKHPFLAPTWASIGRTRAGRHLFAEFLSSAKMRSAGIFRPAAINLARLVMKWCPLPRGLARKMDAFLGTVLTTHMLHEQFIATRIFSDANFPMVDRSPPRMFELNLAA